MHWLRGLSVRCADAWIPASVRRGDSETLRRSRVIASSANLLLLLSLEALVFFSLTLPAQAGQTLALSSAAAIALLFFIPRCFRDGSLITAINVLLGASFAVIATTIVILGGIRAPILHWLALLPMFAILMGSRASAWVWSGVGLLTLAVLTLADVGNLQIHSHLEASGFTGSRLWLQRFIDVGSWITILFGMALLYDRQKELHTRDLESTNAILTREVSQRERAEERTRYLAYYDELTTLPNRLFLKEKLAHAMHLAEREKRMVGILYLDLDGFKQINDRHGHDVGDLVLREVAQRLMGCVRSVDAIARSAAPGPSGIVSRLGGDEFTVLLENIRSGQEATLVADRILTCLQTPFAIGGRELLVTTSVGIALYPTGVSSGVSGLDELLKHADLAMYHAKDSGRNAVQCFESWMLETAAKRTSLGDDLRRACARSELVLHYQPILDLRLGRSVGVEALVRWRHPKQGLVMPAEFVEIAEETGLIVPIGEWILREACLQARRWQQDGMSDLRVSVNVSGIQFKRQRLGETVRRIVRECGLAPDLLELEITESAVMADEADVERTLAQIKEIGVRIALDDFGTGYSSLSYLKRLPVDTLKIDQTFIRDVAHDEESRAIATAIITLAHDLKLRVVAEGVETAEQESFLLASGCSEMQGFRFAGPVRAEEIPPLLRRHWR